MKLITLLFVIFSPLFFNAQITIKGKIINSNNEPLQYSNVVCLKENKGTISNNVGEFSFTVNNLDDSIKVTNIGYAHLVFSLKDIKNPFVITLQEQSVLLQEVIVRDFSHFKNKQSLGYDSYKKNGFYKLAPGNQIAVFIPNLQQREGWLKNIKFGLQKIGDCKTDFRIRVLSCNQILVQPNYDILDENLIISKDNLSKKNEIDISEYHIIFPKEGVFIMLEYLDFDGTCTTNAYTEIAANMKLGNNITWQNYRDRKWTYRNSPISQSGKYLTPNIGITVTY